MANGHHSVPQPRQTNIRAQLIGIPKGHGIYPGWGDEKGAAIGALSREVKKHIGSADVVKTAPLFILVE